MPLSNFTISYDDEKFTKKVVKKLTKYGVVIIEDVFSNEAMDQGMEEMMTSFEKVCPKIKRHDLKNTWKVKNLIPQTRSGLFQSMVGNFPIVWKLRSDEKIRKIFTDVYSGLRGETVDDFVVGLDGANFRPPYDPFTTEKTKDWAHLDLTLPNATYFCVQGQIVMSDSSASFVASPKSHLVYEKILERGNKLGTPRNWYKLPPEEYEPVKKMVEEQKGEFQIPILSKKGSVILWLSSLVHSARTQTRPTKTDLMNKHPWYNWRGVVYVCYRPRQDVNYRHTERLQRCFKENRITNHWGEKMFSKRPRYSRDKDGNSLYESGVAKYIEDPSLVYQLADMKVELTDEIKKLL